MSQRQRLGLSAIDQLLMFHGKEIPIVTLIQLVADTLSKEKDIERRIEFAKEEELYELAPAEFSRTAINAFRGEFIYEHPRGLEKLTGEDHYLRRLFQDPEFEDLRIAYLAERISVLSALGEMQVRMIMLNSVFHIFNNLLEEGLLSLEQDRYELPKEKVCSLVYGDGENSANPLFKKYADFVESETFSGSSVEARQSLIFMYSQLYFDYLIRRNLLTQDESNLRLELAKKLKALEEQAMMALGTGQLQSFIDSHFLMSPKSCN